MKSGAQRFFIFFNYLFNPFDIPLQLKMKNMKYTLIASILLIGLMACSKKKTEKNIEGSWKVTRFIDSGEDKTAAYSGATFTFNKNGNLTFQHGSSYSGNWKIEKESDDDHPKNSMEFYILVSGHESLSDDWHIESESKSKLSLVDYDDDEPSESDYLTLEKI